MKFSYTEQQAIIALCEWANRSNSFYAVRTFFKEKALPVGTGIFTFSKEDGNRPVTVLCLNFKIQPIENLNRIYNDVLFYLHFLRKLERLGLVTISEGRYDSEKEYSIASFNGVSIIGIRRHSESPLTYSFLMQEPGDDAQQAVLSSDDLTIRDFRTTIPLDYHNVEIFSRFDSFGLISSNIAVEQELFDLKEHDFKTIEERMLETADNQLTTAKDILTQAKEQSTLALADMNQAKTNFETAQKNAREQFDEEQKSANQRFATEQENARKNLEFTQAELDRRFKESQEASEKQYQDSRKESKRQFDDAQKESREQFERAQKDSKRALWLAVISIIASIATAFIVAIFVPTTINRGQLKKVNNTQKEILNKLEEINLKVVETETDTTLYVVPDQLDEISTTLKNVNNKLVKPAQK